MMCGEERSRHHPHCKHSRRLNGLVSYRAPLFPFPTLISPMVFISSLTTLFTCSFYLSSVTYTRLLFLRDSLVHLCVSGS